MTGVIWAHTISVYLPSTLFFSELEKFTGDEHIDLRQWLRNCDRCCVIAEKSDDLVAGQLVILCVDGRAKVVIDQRSKNKAIHKNIVSFKSSSMQFLILTPTARHIRPLLSIGAKDR